jgi:hypothetical protein
MSNITQLIRLAQKDGAWWLNERTMPEVLAELDKPNFTEAREFHDWRNYVSIWTKCWKKLSLETRFVLYHAARMQADNEQWE